MVLCVTSLNLEVTGGCELQVMWVLRLNWSSLEEQVLLTFDTFPVPKFLNIICFVKAFATEHVKIIIDQVMILSSFFPP